MLRLEGFDPVPRATWWAPAHAVVARSRCRLRWFRLSGIPLSERLAALRLQVEVWRPFENTAARLVLAGEDGLAIAWDATAAHQELLAAGVPPERCSLTPETLTYGAFADGLVLVRGLEGFEAQSWKGGVLRASRWWVDPLTEQDWSQFVHASGAERDVDCGLPQPQEPTAASVPWAKHYPLSAKSSGADGLERRAVYVGALALASVVGVLGHQLWDARQQGLSLTRQIDEAKAVSAPVLGARDAAMSAVDEVGKLAAWFSLPLPVDVIGYLHEALGQSGVQIKELELEGNKLRLGLLLGPNTTRAAIVKDLQAGGWLTDVVEARADNSRGLLQMDMRIAGVRPPVAGAVTPAAPAAVAAVAPAAPAAAGTAAPVAKAPMPAAAATPPVQAAPPGQVKPPPGPAKPIIAKPDANGMPPPEVFNAIPNR